MSYIFYILIFIFGAIVGSFLNVLIYRHNTGVSAVGGRSFCFSCSHPLSWYDLVPLVSFLWQRGRCRYCKSKISWQYPIVELLTGGMFVLLFMRLMLDFPVAVLSEVIALGFYLVIFSLLMVIAVYDIRHTIIPNTFVYTFAVLSLMPAVGLIGSANVTLWNLAAGPVLAFPLAALWFISRGRWLGLGDAKLVLGMGWLLGMSAGVAAVMISFWLGAIIGVVLLFLSKLGRLGYTMKSEIPFGPFLIIGTFLTFFFTLTFADIQLLLTF